MPVTLFNSSFSDLTSDLSHFTRYPIFWIDNHDYLTFPLKWWHDYFSKTLQDTGSSLYPVLVRPWTVNKVTCGSLLTLLDNSLSDVTVSFDACLVALILLNIFIFGPLLFADVGDKFSNIFYNFQDRIDRIESTLGLENHFEAYRNPTIPYPGS